MMMGIASKKEHCYGCIACASICPKGAVKMVKDAEGFPYPEIDDAKCIGCGMCERVCPYLTELPTETWPQRFFAVQHNDQNVVMQSSSGGLFTALSDCVLDGNGVVFGVVFDKGFVVRHERADCAADRDAMRGSKYIQSDMDGVMQLVLNALEERRQVLFVGTPCQAAGLRNFILLRRKSLDGLLLCDFICHGTASPAVWDAYVNFLEQRHGSGLELYNFRGKMHGWHFFTSHIVLEGKDYSERYRKKDSFFLLYKSGLINRPSCYSCRFTSYTRCSDITMGDFWNIGKVAPEMNDNRGTSQVLINSAKGDEWFRKCRKDIISLECQKEDVWQPHLEYSDKMPAHRKRFWDAFNNEDFSGVIKKYGRGNFMTRCKGMAVPLVKKFGLYKAAGKLYRRLIVGGKQI